MSLDEGLLCTGNFTKSTSKLQYSKIEFEATIQLLKFTKPKKQNNCTLKCLTRTQTKLDGKLLPTAVVSKDEMARQSLPP
jgi:hypothetical protein